MGDCFTQTPPHPDPVDPLCPQNVEVLSPFTPGALDIRWDNPAILAGNSVFTVVGVNLYRSDVSDRGPFFRINEFPLGGTFYRDQTTNVLIANEVVDWDSSWVFKGNGPNDPRWVFRTKYAIVKKTPVPPNQTVTYANATVDVEVAVNGVRVPVEEVFGQTGEVVLVNEGTFNVATEDYEPVPRPSPDATVTVSYYANCNHVRSGLDAKLWYRATTVVLAPEEVSGLKESPIEWCEPKSVIEVEDLDYIWKRAIRMNHWVLQQGGERVKVFIRREAGLPCPCKLEARTRAFSKQPSNRCDVCFGTGFVGGYDGPYDIIIAPDDFERRISQSITGRRKEHTGEVWMGPSPAVTMRDFIVKQTNERYSIGPVRRPSNRGNLLQQHFNIAYLDEGDIRYKVPIVTGEAAFPQTRYDIVYAPMLPVDGSRPDTIYPWNGDPPFPTTNREVVPLITEKDNTPDPVEQRGRTAVWENINY